MDADVSSALLGSSGGVQCEKRKGVIRRLLEWIRKQWGRVRNFFRRRKKQPVVTDHKTVVEEEDDIETVALSVYEAPAKVSLAPETTPEPKVEEYVLDPVPNLAAIQKEREETEAKTRAKEEEARRKHAEEARKKEEEERAAARKRAEEQRKAQEEAKARKLAQEKAQAKKIASLNMAMDESARSESSRSVSDPVPDLEPIVKKDQKGIPVTMEDAMELTTNARRASLPVAAVAATSTTKKTKASKKKETRRASYAIGAKPPVAPKQQQQQQARRSSSIEWVESAPAQLKKTAELQPQQATKDTATTAATRRTSTSSIEWVESAPAQLRKTEAGQKAMLDGSLERSITRINEEQDPNLAWEKPDWAKQGGRKSLRKSFQHNLW